MKNKIDTLVVVTNNGEKVYKLKKIIEKPKSLDDIRLKLKELFLVRGSLQKEDKTESIKEQLTAVNNQIMILYWVLGREDE